MVSNSKHDNISLSQPVKSCTIPVVFEVTPNTLPPIVHFMFSVNLSKVVLHLLRGM